MAMTKKAGAELKTGCLTLSGMVAQTVTKTAGGELREYRDEDGDVFSVYLYDGHEQMSFEGLLKSTDADALKTKGSTIVIGTGSDAVTYYITDYSVQFTNNDVSKVSGSARTYPDIVETPAQNGSST